MPDPRTTAGELMCPALYPSGRVSKLKRELLRDYSAQFQQQPTTEAGAHFHRAWLPVRAVRPAGDPVARCRFWDLASTKQRPGTDPDWTAGALVSRWLDGLYSVDDVVKLQGYPWRGGQDDPRGDSAGRPRSARADRAADRDRSGVFQASAYTQLLAGFDYAPVKPTGEKSSRWRPLSVQAEGGNIWLAEGAWNDPFVRELCDLPGRHDDQADAAAGARSTR